MQPDYYGRPIIVYKLPDGRYKTALLSENTPQPTKKGWIAIEVGPNVVEVETEEYFRVKLARLQPFPLSQAQAERLKMVSGPLVRKQSALPRAPAYVPPTPKPPAPRPPPPPPPGPTTPGPDPEPQEDPDDKYKDHPKISLLKMHLPKPVVDTYDKLSTQNGGNLPGQAVRFYLRTLWGHVNRQNFEGKLQRCDFAYLRKGNIDSMHKRAHWSPRARIIAISPHLFNAPFEIFIETFVHEMCVSGDALIPTELGLIRIDKLAERSGAAKVLTRSGSAVIKKVWCSGEKTTYTIRTERGKELRLTGNHPVLVFRPDCMFKWKRVDKLVLGDVLVNRLGGRTSTNLDLTFARTLAQDSWSYRTRKKTETLPSAMTPELARILGYLTAEGSFVEGANRNTITFSNTNQELIDDFRNCWEACFDFSPLGRTQVYGKDSRSITDVVTTRSDLAIWFEAIGLKRGTAPTKEVPFSILESSSEAKAQFLRAFIEGDGYLSEGGVGGLEIKLASKLLVQQLQLLFETLGIPSNGVQFVTGGYTGTNTYHSLRISDAADALALVGAVSKKRIAIIQRMAARKLTKKNYVEGKLNRLPYVAAYVREKELIIEGNGRFPQNVNGDCNPSLLESVLFSNDGDPDAERLRSLSKPKFVFDRVESITLYGTEPVYDMTTSAGEFVANGLVIHNCHQAVTDLEPPGSDMAEWRLAKGHGPLWKKWMVNCGLSPNRYDTRRNEEYMNTKQRDVLDQELDRFADQLLDRKIILNNAPVPMSEIHIGDRLIRAAKSKKHGLVHHQITAIFVSSKSTGMEMSFKVHVGPKTLDTIFKDREGPGIRFYRPSTGLF